MPYFYVPKKRNGILPVMNASIQEIVKDPLSSLLIIGNIILIESLLSVDNAAVLATMVLKLSRRDRVRALRYGIMGAYIFRGVCLFAASYLVTIWWLKVVGGLYLLYLCVDWWIKRNKKHERHGLPGTESKLYQRISNRIGVLWATVISVELMDMAFSIDNVFAAVAFSDNIIIILIGVFIGILAMRFIAQGFVRLIEKYPFLEGCAYIVIGLLGIKLTLSLYEHYAPGGKIAMMLDDNTTDRWISAFTIGIFFIPIVTSMLFDFPKKKKL
jgi:YkoY family integral membrane protein